MLVSSGVRASMEAGPSSDAEPSGDIDVSEVEHLTKVFDVSKPWLNRVLEGAPRQHLTAVKDVTFGVPAR
ncbi:MAG: hypothetical protein AAFQ35_15240, partial [Pseudomonadota bacterium]